jgi:fumarate reductase subunit D
MARSNKPILWLPFAAGGLVAALVLPALILLTGLLLPLGVVQLPFDKVLAFAQHPIGKLLLFGTIALSSWHAAHRLRMTAHDLGLGGGLVIRAACYGAAGALILGAAIALLIPPS